MMLPLLASCVLHVVATQPSVPEPGAGQNANGENPNEGAATSSASSTPLTSSDAIVIPAAAAGGAVVGYAIGFATNLVVMNGSNPINSLVQHPGEAAFEQAGLIIAPVLVFPSTAIAAWAGGARFPLAIGLVTAGTTLAAHGVVLAMSPLLRDVLDPAFGEAAVLVVVGAFTASVAAGAGFVDAAGPALLDE